MTVKTKKVRIVSSSSPVYWYANKIGEILTVEVPMNEFGEEDDDLKYVAKDTEVGTICFVDRADVEDVEEDVDDVSKDQLQTLIIELSKTVAGLRSEMDALSEELIATDYKAGQALTSAELNGEGDINDVVNKPSHYTQGDIEVIDYIDQVSEAYSGKQAYYVGNVIKYVSRAPHKNGVEDIDKALVYLDWLATSMADGYGVDPFE